MAQDGFALTDVQISYLFGTRSGVELGGSPARFVVGYDGAPGDGDRLEAALQATAARHDAAATVVDADTRTQRVVPDAVRARLRAVQAGTPEADRLLEEVRGGTAGGPPLDAVLVLGGSAGPHLLIGADLLVLDVPGTLALLAEWRRRYDGASDDGPAPSFAEAVRAGAPGDLEAAERYWTARSDEFPAFPELPLAGSPAQEAGTDHHRATVDARTWAAVRSAAGERGLEPGDVLVAACAEVLRTWAKEPNFLLTVTGRLAMTPEAGVGNLATPSLLAVAAEPGSTFAERTAALGATLRADHEHRVFSGVRVLRELGRRTGNRPTAPVVFTDARTRGEDPLSAFGRPVTIGTRTPQVRLEQQVFDHAGGLLLVWNAATGSMPDGVVEAMAAAHVELLEQLATGTDAWDRPGSAVPLPTAHAAEQEAANATAAPIPPARLHDLVGAAAVRDPDATAVIDVTGSTTFAELTALAHRIGRRIQAVTDLAPGALVAVSLRPGAGLIAALLGVLHAGGAYVAVDPELPRNRRHALMRRCGVPVVIAEPDAVGEQPDDVVLITTDAPEVGAADPTAPESPQGVDDLAYVIFTSGSTGEPKGVMINHRMAANTVQDVNARFGVGPTDRALALAPAGFDLSVYDVFGVLGAGGALVVPDGARGADPDHWSELVQRHRVTIWNSVPAPVRIWADTLRPSEPRAASLRLVMMSGDWIPLDLPDALRAAVPGVDVVSLGGATEGSIWSIHHRVGQVDPDWTSIPYGKALANQTMHVLDRWGDPRPTWAVGEIHIGGTGVAAGYWADPERTAERFVTDPRTGARRYRTGDLGRFRPGGDIEILGREDHQVKINGFRVELGEIETVLARLPEVRQVVVAAPAHPRTGHRQVVAHLVVDDPAAADPTAVRAAAAGELPPYMVPSHVLPLAALPLTVNGKIDHAALPLPWAADDEPGPAVAPDDPVQRELLAIWAAGLGHDEFGAADGFFDVGGDSLHAVAILREVRERFGIGPGTEQDLVEALFTNADVATVAGIVAEAAGARR
ncbi:non-ribosomal peptide synthetase [Saccharopolyspora sp. CA-218241]|uniref:non-ribosomal peptide synthetase n=1 Tax=Saccharopolyspora sp. CA-218241 TaxID=3240027 RepID=UPI003D994A2D